jgi:sensor histidine kinase regulating citrate/malate metabolism
MEQNILEKNAEQSPLFHGTGVGLWLVKSSIARSSGTITVTENTPLEISSGSPFNNDVGAPYSILKL